MKPPMLEFVAHQGEKNMTPQVVQHKIIIIRKIQRQAQERMEKEEECLLQLKKKNNSKKKKNGAQLPLTYKTSPPFIEVILARSPSDLQEGD